MKKYAEKFYKNARWLKMRAYIYSRDKGLCQDCLKRGLYVPMEEVHHIIPITPDNIDDPDITLNEKNLISLCRECHRARHGEKEKKKRFEVDSRGVVSPLFR